MTCKNAAMKRHWGAVVRGLLSPALVMATHLPNWIEIKAKVVSLSLSFSASLALFGNNCTAAARSAFECARALSHIFAVEAVGLPSHTRSCRSNICEERAIKFCVCLFQQIIAYVGIIIHIKNKTYIYFIFVNVLEYINVWKLKNKLTKKNLIWNDVGFYLFLVYVLLRNIQVVSGSLLSNLFYLCWLLKMISTIPSSMNLRVVRLIQYSVQL